MLSEYYDKLYVNKDYAKEVETVLEIFGGEPNSVLDVGCGTGNHAFLLAERGIEVVGIDPDLDMIKVARSKCERGKDWPRFFCGEIGVAPTKKVDLAISLFNVVNYIEDMADLLDFFTSIRQRLRRRGVFVFDCWNGIAAIVDPPCSREGNSPHTDRMSQRTVVANRVGEVSFTYMHRLWTPVCLEGLLGLAKFRSVILTAWMEQGKLPTEEMRRLMFICRS